MCDIEQIFETLTSCLVDFEQYILNLQRQLFASSFFTEASQVLWGYFTVFLNGNIYLFLLTPRHSTLLIFGVCSVCLNICILYYNKNIYLFIYLLIIQIKFCLYRIFVACDYMQLSM